MKSKYHHYYEELGYNIAYYRKKNGLTQEMLAEKIGIDRAHISKIEVATVGVSLDKIFALAEALGVKPHKFLEFRE